jgi:phage tail sheath protein FI
MPEYLSPGVYVEEVDAGPKPIEGVSTSTAGAVGVTERGPSGGSAPGDTTNRGKPVLVTSFAEFTRTFGGFLPEPDPHLVNRWALDPTEGGRWWLFPLSVKGFFDNGGQRLYVRRAFAAGPPGGQGATQAQSVMGTGIIAEVAHDAAAGDRTVQLQHLFGIQNATGVTIVSGGRALAPAVAFTVTSYDPTTNSVVLNQPIGQELKANRDFLYVSRGAASPAPNASTLRFRAKSVGDWGGNLQGDHPLDGIRVKVRPMVGATLRILGDPATGGNPSQAALVADAAVNATALTVDTIAGFANLDHVLIRGRQFVVNGAPAANSVAISAAPAGATEAANVVTITTAAPHGFNPGDTVTIAGVAVPGYNGTIVVATVTATTFTYNNPTTGLAASGGGTAARPTINIQPVTGAPAQATVDTVANSGAVRANNVVTIQTAAAHTFGVGDSVVIAGVADASFNGSFLIATVPDTTHFTYAQPGAASVSGAGTVTQRWHAAWAAGTPIRRLRPANTPAAGLHTINVQGASQLYLGALVELDNGTNKERFNVDLIDGQIVTLSGTVPAQNYFEGNRLRVIEAEVLARYEKDGLVLADEDLTNLQLFNDGSAGYIVNAVNSRSQLVDVETLVGAFSAANFADFPATPPPAVATDPDTLWERLDGGDDHYELLTVDDFVGVDGGSGARTGIQALEDIEDVAICMVPNVWSTTVESALITHCEFMRYRFGILDPQDGLSIDGIRTFREPLDTKYAALYHPWLEVRDPSVQRNVQVAPSGHMAGIYARVDVQRGVHKAPANEVIESITKIAQDISKREQDVLNPVGIDALRFFPNRGNRVWGARTVSSDSSWKYINVRRLFIYVEHSIDNGTQWVVFEPNDEPLWARVRQTITNFLTTVWRSGALQGIKPDEAFFVKCDRTTMTQDDIDNGRLICVIGIAPVKPAEFVIFRIQQKTLDSTSN